jgi:hypothetical protein
VSAFPKDLQPLPGVLRAPVPTLAGPLPPPRQR